MTRAHDHVRNTLRAHALRCTPQRELIYASLAARHTHPTAEELLGAVREHQPGLSLATVYNALEAFTHAGLVRRIAPAGGVGPCRYDADIHDHLHAALPDGRVVDLPPGLAAGLRAATGKGFRESLAAHLAMPVQEIEVRVIVR